MSDLEKMVQDTSEMLRKREERRQDLMVELLVMFRYAQECVKHGELPVGLEKQIERVEAALAAYKGGR